MKHLLLTFGMFALSAYGAGAVADDLLGGDAEAGKAKTAACAACHGADGNSVNPEWPKIAGQHATYLYEQMQHFKQPQGDDSLRYNALMFGQMQALSDDDMKNLASYYAAQEQTPGVADPANVEFGEKIYRGGIAKKNVPACIACHGPSGDGNAAAKFPVLGGQHSVYLVNQMKAYASGERRTDAAQVMRNIAASMSEDEMKAVANYLQGLQD